MAIVYLEPDRAATINAGPHTIRIVRDRAGHVGVEDSRGAWCPPIDTTPKHTFEVVDNHPLNGDGGQQARELVAKLDGVGADLPGDAPTLIAYLAELVRVHPMAPSLVLVKLYRPHMSIRELARTLRLGKSAVAQAVRKLSKHDRRLARLVVGPSSTASEGQRRRRLRERAVNYV